MPMKQRCGVLVYNKERDRIDIRFDLNNYYGGLHCGQCFDVMVGGRWVPTRIEMASTWYLVGIQTDSDKWKVLILRDLLPGTKRFGELKKSIGHVSQKVLTAQLREMEENGLLTRTVYAEVPPRVEYTLTDLGYSLKPILDALWNWGENYKAQNS